MLQYNGQIKPIIFEIKKCQPLLPENGCFRMSGKVYVGNLGAEPLEESDIDRVRPGSQMAKNHFFFIFCH